MPHARVIKTNATKKRADPDFSQWSKLPMLQTRIQTDFLDGRDNDGGLRKIISQIGPKNGLIGGKNAGLIDLSRTEGGTKRW